MKADERMKAMAAVARAVSIIGGQSEVARALGITRQAVHNWKVCPAKYVRTISQMSEVPREELRPDIYAGWEE